PWDQRIDFDACDHLPRIHHFCRDYAAHPISRITEGESMNSSTLNQVAPDISVAICTYNRSKQLGSTLETVRNQTLPGKTFEIVVIDDGSTDHTERVVSDFGRNSGVPVRYFKQENAGIGQARNRAVAHARAPWVA